MTVKAVKEASPDNHVFEGRVCSGDQFISKKEQKDKITSNFGGMCCEMEGAAIAQTCYLNKTPFIIIRTISDKPDETEIVEYKDFEAEAEAFCLAECLKEQRRLAGLTQEQLAAKIGTKKSYISKIENGHADIQLSTLFRIFSGLGRRISLTVL